MIRTVVVIPVWAVWSGASRAVRYALVLVLICVSFGVVTLILRLLADLVPEPSYRQYQRCKVITRRKTNQSGSRSHQDTRRWED